MSDTGSAERVTLTVDGGIADVRLNRPEKRNALDLAMFEALVVTGERLKTQPDCGRGALRCRARLLRRV